MLRFTSGFCSKLTTKSIALHKNSIYTHDDEILHNKNSYDHDTMHNYTNESNTPQEIAIGNILAPSAPPTSASVSEVTSSSITVQWVPVDCIHRNGDITRYTVRVSTSGEAERAVSVDESARETTSTGLIPVTEYNVSVAAENRVGAGLYSSSFTIQTGGEFS